MARLTATFQGCLISTWTGDKLWLMQFTTKCASGLEWIGRCRYWYRAL